MNSKSTRADKLGTPARAHTGSRDQSHPKQAHENFAGKQETNSVHKDHAGTATQNDRDTDPFNNAFVSKGIVAGQQAAERASEGRRYLSMRLA